MNDRQMIAEVFILPTSGCAGMKQLVETLGKLGSSSP